MKRIILLFGLILLIFATSAWAADGTCSSVSGGAFSSQPQDLCSSGTPTTPTYSDVSGEWNWECDPTDNCPGCGEMMQLCTAYKLACGSSNGGALTTAPVTGLCAHGTPSSVTGGNGSPWVWTCAGVDNSIVSCSATASGSSSSGTCTWSSGNNVGYDLYGVAYGNNEFVAVGIDGTIATSGDGATWSRVNSAAGKTLWSVAYGNGAFVAVGDQVMFVSTDNGTTWQEFTVDGYTLYGVTYGNGMFVVVGEDSSDGLSGAVYKSTDGINWQGWTNTYALYSVTYGNGLFVAGSDGVMLSSSDGLNWYTNYAGSSSFSGQALAYGNNEFVAVDMDLDAITSTDGVTWTDSHSGENTSSECGIAFGDNTFVAVDGSTVRTSADGIHWTDNEFSNEMGAVAYGNGIFVAVGSYGNTAYSAVGGGTSSGGMPVPSGPLVVLEHFPIVSPIVNQDPGQSYPIAFGPAASGGNTLNLEIALEQFTEPVDIYLVFYLPAIDPAHYYYVTSDHHLDQYSNVLLPWKIDSYGGFDETVFKNIPLSALPWGLYDFYVLTVPAGETDLSNYYLWEATFHNSANTGGIAY
jgi:hypothetical protein